MGRWWIGVSCSGFHRCMIRDEHGSWIQGFTKTIGAYSILDAELWGVYEGLKVASTLEIRRLQVETDSMEVWKLLRQGLAMDRISPMVSHIVLMLENDWELCFSHVPRERNVIAMRWRN
ncbi:hypothetical protein F3Y22_tig00111996pilonHSYRG00170 [Hibiscus syriacus]|uniref:RNase H type-1 domain-containing protein n=1 Tax=Hibiscus syriacus TaxID=106335 RepID=A0A6A2YA30_HIBSY|nr:hypothetical protein F3Y22_tig00111996pilonHSYRG00170 [Hibiscus syriacus]